MVSNAVNDGITILALILRRADGHKRKIRKSLSLMQDLVTSGPRFRNVYPAVLTMQSRIDGTVLFRRNLIYPNLTELSRR